MHIRDLLEILLATFVVCALMFLIMIGTVYLVTMR